jgi:hypothetical protein
VPNLPNQSSVHDGKRGRVTRWEHEEVVEAVQERLDKNPDAMRTRRETVEHPFGTIKMRMGATGALWCRMRTTPDSREDLS